MASRVRRRGGTQAANDAFTGAEREITVDTTNWNLRLHDGATQGGHPLVPGARSLTGGDGIQTIGDLSQNRTVAVDSTVVRTSRSLTGGDGIQTIGDLSQDRTVAVDGTVLRDSDLASGGGTIVEITRLITAGTGLTGGGDLSGDISFAVDGTVLRDSQVVTVSSGAADSGKLVDLDAAGQWDTSVIPTLDLSFISDSGAAAAKGVTGSDADAVTGTAGANGNLGQWNSDGDLVDSGVAVDFESWTNATLSNGWATAGTPGAIAPRFRKDPTGHIVYLAGWLDGDTNTGNVALTLPSGYRPTSDTMLIALSTNGAEGGATNGQAKIFIDNGTGDLTVSAADDLTVVSLDGLQFHID